MRPLIGIPCAGNLRSSTGYRRFAVGQRYCLALHMAGGAPILIPLLDDEQALEDIYQELDGLLLAGGGDVEAHHFGQQRLARLSGLDRPRDRAELWLARRAFQDDLPLLGICRGVQVLTVALGGTLVQDIPTLVPMAVRHNFRPDYPRNFLGHEIELASGTRLAGILECGRTQVNSLHHQCVQNVPRGLLATAHASDGVIEAVEAPGKRFVLGVQWHPEELVDDDARMLRLFETFVEAATASRVVGEAAASRRE